jgi:serine/threonine protein kinase
MSEVSRHAYCGRCLTTFSGDPDGCPNLACRSNRPDAGWGALLEEGDVLDRHYGVLRRLAIGGAGVTYLARELGDDGQPVGDKLAVKVLFAQRDQGAFLRRLATEAQILLELAHPNIVTIRGFVQRAGHSPYLVTRFEEGGSLLDHLRRAGPMTIRDAAAMGVQLCEGLERAHRAGVIHRDLKPENILLTHVPARGEVPIVKLTDFGIAKVYGGFTTQLTRVGAFVGTPQYAAPEQFQSAPPTPAADVFSIAAVLQFCVTLRPVLGDIDMGDLDGTLDRLQQRVPVVLDASKGEPQDVAGFNAFLASTMGFHPDHRVPIEDATKMLADIAAGVPVLAPQTVPNRTAVPDLEPVTTAIEEITPPPDGGPDTFEGILSHQDGEPQPGTAAMPLAQKQPVAPDAPAEPGPADDPDGAEVTEQVRPSEHEVTERADAPDHAEHAEPPTPEPDPAPPKKRSRAPLMVLIALLLGAVCTGIPAALWFENPSALPGAVVQNLPPAHALDPSDPEHTVVMTSVLAQTPRMVAGCSPGAGRVQLYVDVEFTGKVRRVHGLQAQDVAAAQCVAENVLALQFERSTLQAVVVGVSLDL